MKFDYHRLTEKDLARFQRHVSDGDLRERKLRESTFAVAA